MSSLAAPAQSALHAQGEQAAHVLEITWVLFIGGALIFALVLLMLVAALMGPDAVRRRLAANKLVIGAGIVFPVVTLTGLLVYSFGAAGTLVRAPLEPAAARIEVTGEMWWWRVRYLDAAGAVLLETANEIYIPVGQPVDLQLVSADVVHSFWVPSLAGKLDMLPGRVNRMRVRATEPGLFRGQCAEFCGLQHAKMALHVVAQPPPQFEAWLQARQQPGAEPTAALARQGQALFAQARCALCHSIRGTAAAGTLGPDLTHVGSRLTLAAGTLANGRGALASWISDPQHIKAGSRMPAYQGFSADEVDALVTYLEGLR